MRKIILQEFTTIDGFAAGPKGELDFMDAFSTNRAVDQDLLYFMDTIDTILLGRLTYELFAEFWPTATTDTEIIADRLNGMPKLVFSKTLEAAPWGEWKEAKVMRADAADELRNLKQQPGKDMVLWGSLKLAQSLMKERLIDEYQLRVCPLAIGKGKHLFPPDFRLSHLRLMNTKVYEQGIVLMNYEINNNQS
ncbi:dihydrofolate reductase [Catalinimonas alkaloidigena]|uniref:dihydrofolate reductase family protein n=1 Tax=Catalinimonas alkaloidigena TaxID=1075417 RepID=UPI002405D9B4|nr:dihydrofolate reductase family protein [Catalinimonas alkaloidigena]MDF9798703.1 dihydrofolate reductase [Catalinimonas alkaloidigena]